MVVGGLDVMTRLRDKMEDLRKRVGFYKGRYYESMLVDHIEHYIHLIAMGTTSTHTSMVS